MATEIKFDEMYMRTYKKRERLIKEMDKIDDRLRYIIYRTETGRFGAIIVNAERYGLIGPAAQAGWNVVG